MAEATQDAAKPARTVDPHYTTLRREALYRLTGVAVNDASAPEDVYEPVAAFVLIDGPVESSTSPKRKEAIKEATSGMSEDEQYGEFATVLAGQFKMTTRERKTEPKDVWS